MADTSSGETLNDKYSIKNLLFTKAIPNYVIPVPINGQRVFACIDCGDKYILESSYDFHINRKSIKISYMCRHCNQMKIFYNRCNFLSHIRSHSFKTATINVADLKIEPLPLDFFNMSLLESSKEKDKTKSRTQAQWFPRVTCIECKKDITISGTTDDRVKHYMAVTDKVYACPVCLVNLPTECALRTHMRVHLKQAPYTCPECGTHLSNRSIAYPFHDHDCESFKMMRATARVKCEVDECFLYHPNDHKEHIRKNHLTKVYKCSSCHVGCFDYDLMIKHIQRHASGGKPSLFYQCGLCNGKVIMNNQIDEHLNSHKAFLVYNFPCWACGTIFKQVSKLIEHHINQHGANETLANLYKTMCEDKIQKNQPKNATKRMYRVVKRCEKCNRSFKYKCKFDQIEKLPYACPYKCTMGDTDPEVRETNNQIICHLCKSNMTLDWEVIKKHYAQHHNAYRCLDAKVSVKRLPQTTFNKYLKKYFDNKEKASSKACKKSTRTKTTAKNNKNKDADVTLTSTPASKKGENCCGKCGDEFENKELLEAHLIVHRDPCMAYQCLECGQCFVVKPTFSKHLLLEHDISDVEDYIKTKEKCFNESALQKYQYNTDPAGNEPLKENQCKICREQFKDASDLEKHFRVHGMAFLMKTKTNNSP